MLFVPGDRKDRYAKATASLADAVVIDLEDAVAPGAKDVARAAADAWLHSGGEAVVRINGIETEWLEDDLAMTRRHRCPVMVPKVESAAQIRRVSAELGSETPIIALIETPVGVLAAQEICSSGAVARAAFGSVDLGAELGIDPADHEALLHARSMLVLASVAGGKPAPLDGVTVDVHNDRAVRDDSAHAVRLGFGGKLCIHPRQVQTINDAFTPTIDDVNWAEEVMNAASSSAVSVVGGRMVDKPVRARAAEILNRVRRAESIDHAPGRVGTSYRDEGGRQR
ncbi:CoA ester lyase [Mycobacterium sp. 1274756.6]|uniref:HpcH/HpaI aldolase/citrate lyase family protein n=1 Tax=Mycobacterium sp. 1274756.6 TaxID=1834076 RepID=UPI0009EEE070|nr:CoA ester lyase [Mycobacterium sp. 1274756.6]